MAKEKIPDPRPFVREFNAHAMENIVSQNSDVYIFCASNPEYHFEKEVTNYGIKWTKKTDLVQAYIASLNQEDFANNYVTPITPRYMVTDITSDRHLIDLFAICDATCNILTFTGIKVLWHSATQITEWNTNFYKEKSYSHKLRGKGYRRHLIWPLEEHQSLIKKFMENCQEDD